MKMKEIFVTITETLEKKVPVMANDEEEALAIVKNLYGNQGEIILDYDDYNGENAVYVGISPQKELYTKYQVIEKLGEVYRELMWIQASLAEINKTEQFDGLSHSGLNRSGDVLETAKRIENIVNQK